MEKITKVSTIYFEKAQGGEFRWITITIVLLALGSILHLIAPNVAGVTPNFVIATYVVAILLVKPTYRQCIGIGLVAGLIEMLTSKSSFPYGNLISEPMGCSVAYLFALYGSRLRIKNYDLRPILSGFLATTASGSTFVYILHLMVGIPIKVVIFTILPVVLLVGLINVVITGLLYIPAFRYLQSSGLVMDEPSYTSDHSHLLLSPEKEGKISIEHVTYTYNRQAEPTLKDITLTIDKGDFLLLTGPSGSGKTTLAMTIIGAIPHFFGGRLQGMIFIDGQAITQRKISQLALTVGTVLADYETQLVTMTVGEEVAFPMENRGFDRLTMEKRTKELLQQVGLEGLEDRAVSDLSGGQRQRLAIAAALATKPDILVLDEPASALDPEGTQALYALLGKLNQEEHMTIILVENSIDDALPYVSRMALLNEGRLLTVDDPQKVLSYMYEHKLYEKALPATYVCQQNLAKHGIYMDLTGGAPC